MSKRPRVVVVDTGCANIASVAFAFERLGTQLTVSDDPKVIEGAERVVFPGVGSAQAAMASINTKKLSATLCRLTQPVLGVCLGMQLMVEDSEEAKNGLTDCLGIVAGHVRRLQVGSLRLPHMGWNQVSPLEDNPLFAGLKDGSYFYFVHSYAVAVGPATAATCDYGQCFSAAIHHHNFFGVQFHPERSSAAGAELLKNFLAI